MAGVEDWKSHRLVEPHPLLSQPLYRGCFVSGSPTRHIGFLSPTRSPSPPTSCKPKHEQPRASKAQGATRDKRWHSKGVCKVLYDIFQLPLQSEPHLGPELPWPAAPLHASATSQTRVSKPPWPSAQPTIAHTPSLAVAHLWAHRLSTT